MSLGIGLGSNGVGATAGTGTVSVASSGSLTSTALVTGGGTTTLQTPNAATTLASTGVMTIPGSLVRSPATITVTAGAGTIDVTKGYSQVNVVAATTLTPNAAGAAGQFIILDITADSTTRVVTIDTASDITITCPASATTTVLLRSDGSGWIIVGGAPSAIDLTAGTTPAATQLVALTNPTTGAVTKSTLAQVNVVGNGGTGAATLTIHGVLLGQTASAITATAAGAEGTVLTGHGASDPTFDFPHTVINSQSAAYGIILTDGGGTILHPTADNNARTFTIPANGTIAMPVGTIITIVNQINTVSIAITTDTLTLFAGSGTATTGTRTLAAGGIATLLKVASTSWVVSGPGVT